MLPLIRWCPPRARRRALLVRTLQDLVAPSSPAGSTARACMPCCRPEDTAAAVVYAEARAAART
jgi:hypothetical protein